MVQMKKRAGKVSNRAQERVYRSSDFKQTEEQLELCLVDVGTKISKTATLTTYGSCKLDFCNGFNCADNQSVMPPTLRNLTSLDSLTILCPW